MTRIITRCMLCKMEDAGEFCHINCYYLAIFGDYSRNHRHRRHKSATSVLQTIGQIEYSAESCFPEGDYADYAMKAFQQTSPGYRTTLLQFVVGRLQFPSISANLLSMREVMPDSHDQRNYVIKSVIAVINYHLQQP